MKTTEPKARIKRQFRTRKVSDRCYVASALPGEHAYGSTRANATRNLKYDIARP